MLQFQSFSHTMCAVCTSLITLFIIIFFKYNKHLGMECIESMFAYSLCICEDDAFVG